MDEELRGPAGPVGAAVLLGVGLGGFFDGILLHQVLQWHHMLSSAGLPPTSLADLEANTRWDGIFHAATWLATVAGLWLLWSSARRAHRPWPARLLIGGLLAGWGAFNVVEGVVDHHVLGLHHVNETAPPEQWLVWDVAFLAWGLAMVVGGRLLVRAARRAPAREAGAPVEPHDRADRTRRAA